MSAPFPWDLPTATALYVALYLLTLTLHMLLMGYVLAGSGYVALSALIGRPRASLATATLRDWLPFALGAAITAGVAPLLFVQVLYQANFYTANLLLFYRWMAVVPVLILGFYALYLSKSERLQRSRPGLRAAVSVVAFACFSFTGYSWTENHLLALDQDAWADMYASSSVVYYRAGMVPRALFWLFTSLPVMAVILGWQLRWRSPDPNAGTDANEAADGLAGPLALWAGVGLLASCAAAALYVASLEDRAPITADGLGAYLVLVVVGLLAQVGAWVVIGRAGRFLRPALWTATLGALAAMVGALVVRESLRMGSLDMPALAEAHARAAESGGLLLFLFFLVAAVAVMAWCFRITARGLRTAGRE